MFFHNGATSSKKLLVWFFLLLVRSVLCHGFLEASNSSSFNLGSVILEPLDGLRRYVESIVGTHVIGICAEFVEMLLKFVAEGAASGLNVIAVYVSEILRATGVNETISIPHFTAEGVSAVTKWAMLALTGYWILCVLLRVTVAFVRRVFWLLKMVVVMWLFARIVNDPSASTDTTTVRLTLLVLICAVFEVATSNNVGKAASLESRISSLEGQVKGMEKRKVE
ncbi:transmembrane protein 109 isoform X2 [Xyrauchen texanus]|uniref:transmembrane protein 109 isoform X2 n=1 Tax=Xyrauchen texanus TaxID=154827 RepID=UPI00224272AA|nr:transmembrane protein 109 isoform X2 [Xyrauchen texanus]